MSNYVALLAEGVDRNFVEYGLFTDVCQVALLAEGVDRNNDYEDSDLRMAGRPPRGGRG